eukprot:COSAG06_NODE_3508_length_5257_cov_2.595967_2_plen_258_part_00
MAAASPTPSGSPSVRRSINRVRNACGTTHQSEVKQQHGETYQAAGCSLAQPAAYFSIRAPLGLALSSCCNGRPYCLLSLTLASSRAFLRASSEIASLACVCTRESSALVTGDAPEGDCFAPLPLPFEFGLALLLLLLRGPRWFGGVPATAYAVCLASEMEAITCFSSETSAWAAAVVASDCCSRRSAAVTLSAACRATSATSMAILCSISTISLLNAATVASSAACASPIAAATELAACEDAFASSSWCSDWIEPVC